VDAEDSRIEMTEGRRLSWATGEGYLGQPVAMHAVAVGLDVVDPTLDRIDQLLFETRYCMLAAQAHVL
jgi:hypothetical protein